MSEHKKCALYPFGRGYNAGLFQAQEEFKAQLAAERERADAAYNYAEVFQRRLNAAQEEVILLDGKCQLYKARASTWVATKMRALKAEGEAKILREALTRLASGENLNYESQSYQDFARAALGEDKRG